MASSLALHSMKSTMSGWSTLRMTILAARRVLPPDLMTPAKASNPRMKLSGPEAVPPPERVSFEPRMEDRLVPVARAPLEEHALGLGEGQDGVEGVLDRVDEARRALRRAIAGNGEFDGAGVRIPVPVLGIGLGLEAIAADVEPDRRVKGGLLRERAGGRAHRGRRQRLQEWRSSRP